MINYKVEYHLPTKIEIKNYLIDEACSLADFQEQVTVEYFSKLSMVEFNEETIIKITLG